MDEQAPTESAAFHPELREENAAFYGYTPFPRQMTFYADLADWRKPLRCFRLCAGTSKADLLYKVELHAAYTLRGPLHFRRGLYMRNGPTSKAPIFAAAGDEDRLPLLIQTFSLRSVILLPPVDPEEAKNPRDMVTEIMRASTTSTIVDADAGGSKSRIATFRFAIEVGAKMHQREEFEWVHTDKKDFIATGQDAGGSSAAAAASEQDTTQAKRTRYVLLRSRRGVSSRSATTTGGRTSESSDDDDNDNEDLLDGQVLAEIMFNSVMSWNRLFTLEFKAAGLTGELGDRWNLMVVMTAMRICWLRSYGKAGKGVIWAAEKFHGI